MDADAGEQEGGSRCECRDVETFGMAAPMRVANEEISDYFRRRSGSVHSVDIEDHRHHHHPKDSEVSGVKSLNEFADNKYGSADYEEAGKHLKLLREVTTDVKGDYQSQNAWSLSPSATLRYNSNTPSLDSITSHGVSSRQASDLHMPGNIAVPSDVRVLSTVSSSTSQNSNSGDLVSQKTNITLVLFNLMLLCLKVN